MIPLRDENPRRLFPFFTILIIIANVVVHVYQMLLPQEVQVQFVYTFGAVPDSIIHGRNMQSIFTSMFLHGGLLHLLGNMLYLWIFGDNIEGICGHFKFLLFYLLTGVIAFLSHFIVDPFSQIPMIGASGAISGILGAYALRFPRARVHILVPFFPFFWIWRVFAVPAVIVLGFWFAMQLFNAFVAGGGGGVAWLAHIGGFVAGLLLIRRFEKRRYKVYY